MNEVPLDDRAAAIREHAKKVRKAFDRAAVHAENIAGIACFFVYFEPPKGNEGNVDEFTIGNADEIDAALLTHLEEEGINFQRVADAQRGDGP